MLAEQIPPQVSAMPRRSQYGVNMSALARQHGVPLSTFRYMVKTGKVNLAAIGGSAKLVDPIDNHVAAEVIGDSNGSVARIVNRPRRKRLTNQRLTNRQSTKSPIDQPIDNRQSTNRSTIGQSIDNRPIRQSIDKLANRSTNSPIDSSSIALEVMSADLPMPTPSWLVRFSWLRAITWPVAFGLTIVSAYLSITGLMGMFPIAAVTLFGFAIRPMAVMATAIELGKFVGAAWLGHEWTDLGVVVRRGLIIGVLTVAGIGCAGVYGSLIDAQQGPITATEREVMPKLAEVDARIKAAQSDIDAANDRLRAFDDGVTNATNAAIAKGHMVTASTIYSGSQKLARPNLETALKEAKAALPPLIGQRAGFEQQLSEVKSAAGKFGHVANALRSIDLWSWHPFAWLTNELVVQFVIGGITLCADPIAILLVIAAARRRS